MDEQFYKWLIAAIVAMSGGFVYIYLQQRKELNDERAEHKKTFITLRKYVATANRLKGELDSVRKYKDDESNNEQ